MDGGEEEAVGMVRRQARGQGARRGGKTEHRQAPFASKMQPVRLGFVEPGLCV